MNYQDFTKNSRLIRGRFISEQFISLLNAIRKFWSILELIARRKYDEESRLFPIRIIRVLIIDID